MKKLLILLFIVLISFACEKDEIISISLDTVSGFVQKGPYQNGTSLEIFELTEDLNPTGKIYLSQILDNRGTFEVPNIDLSSQFVEIKADGFYFNEVKNESSSAQLTLYALADLSDRSTVNVNILSSLERSRVKYLLSKRKSFGQSKALAQVEIMKIFELEGSEMTAFENLDISVEGEENGMLLAASLIVQGYLSVAKVSELIANISSDIREDADIDDEVLGGTLLSNARLLKVDDIRKNLEKRNESLGLNVTIPDFEKYITQFIENTDFEMTSLIAYPEHGLYGPNLLDRTKTEYSNGDHSLAADLSDGTSLKVKIQGLNWFYPVSQDWSCWEKSDWNDAENSRTFTSKKTGELDLEILLEGDSTGSETNIFVYENGSLEPTWSKTIAVN
ncbi:MAG: hypothetical protein PF450_04285 [Bacteroidales bacterium]|jgi:hypothetical protein|nr:hypothetical protein [Bacteroidales bacterium]